jgi:DNA polymerase elongation subunit (family B)
VVEVDTDGVFFVPPPSIRSEKAETQFVKKIAGTLPAGIVLALNGRYKAMLSYKAKNYALLGYDGRVTLKGSSLTSRTIERFGREYIRRCIEAILRSDIPAIHDAYMTLTRSISMNKLDVSDFSRTETLRDSPGEYEADIRKGKRNRSAPYEAALKELGDWRRGDRVSYYITGTDPGGVSFQNCRLSDGWDPVAPDENTAFYIKRLDEISKKFEPFFTPSDFRKIFSPEDLFGFSPEGIEILTQGVVSRGEDEDLDEDSGAPEPRIWLDT